MVYFIQCASGYIKIGTAKDPNDRLTALQTAHAEPLKLLAVLPGGLRFEHELHERFADVRVGGEWFADAPRLVGFIEGLQFAKEAKQLFDELASQSSYDAANAKLVDDYLDGVPPDDPSDGMLSVAARRHEKIERPDGTLCAPPWVSMPDHVFADGPHSPSVRRAVDRARDALDAYENSDDGIDF